MPKIGDLVAAIGQYKTPQGEEKTRWMNCGMLAQKPNGDYAVKLEGLPLNTEGPGIWLQVFERREDQNPQRQAQNRPPERPQQGLPRETPTGTTYKDFADDDIPF